MQLGPALSALVVWGTVKDQVDFLALVVLNELLQETNERVRVEVFGCELEVNLRVVPIDPHGSEYADRFPPWVTKKRNPLANRPPRVAHGAALRKERLVTEQSYAAFFDSFFLMSGYVRNSHSACSSGLAAAERRRGYFTDWPALCRMRRT